MAEDTQLAQAAGRLLKQKNLWVATAESCTGGLLGQLITSAAGSSVYYPGGLITYSNMAKQRWLGVAPATLQTYGAVSRETVLEMARGVRAAFGGQLDPREIIGIAISGVAGPAGGTVQKPVGTVWIGLSSRFEESAECFHFNGGRAAVRKQSARKALELLLGSLTREHAG